MGKGELERITGTVPFGFTVRLKFVGPAWPATLVAVIARVLVAAVVGVPLSAPEVLSASPAGSAPEVHVIGVVPVAAN